MENLIFLISQPRAGSTMTQKILGAHPEIHTQSEPWILLYPLSIEKKENIVSIFDQELYLDAFRDFIESFPGGRNKYFNDICNTYRSFYNLILEQNKKKIFLDKTPRYYLIIEELINYLPNSKKIVLIRNPIAVFHSIIKTWKEKELYQLVSYKQDLLLAPQIIAKWLKLNKENAIKNLTFIRYEDILKKPEIEIEKLTDFLNVSFHKDMLQYKKNEALNSGWKFGDQRTVNEKSQPDSNHADIWTNSLKDPQLWLLLKEYLLMLGPDLFESLGYDYLYHANLFEDAKPQSKLLKNTISLNSLLDDQRDSIIQLQLYKKELLVKNRQIQQRDQQIQQNKVIIEKYKNSKSYKFGYYFLHPWKIFFS